MKAEGLALCLLFLLAGCSATIERGRGTDVLLDVPFYPYEGGLCGASALASVLSYWGQVTTIEDVAAEVYNPRLKGTLSIDLLLYAERHGLEARLYRGGLRDLKERLDEGIPLIVMVDYGIAGLQKNHFLVVTGYSEEGVLVHTDTRRNHFIPYERFLRIWRRTGYWSLLIKAGD